MSSIFLTCLFVLFVSIHCVLLFLFFILFFVWISLLSEFLLFLCSSVSLSLFLPVEPRTCNRDGVPPPSAPPPKAFGTIVPTLCIWHCRQSCMVACLQSLGTKGTLHPLPIPQSNEPVPQVLNLSCYFCVCVLDRDLSNVSKLKEGLSFDEQWKIETVFIFWIFGPRLLELVSLSAKALITTILVTRQMI